MREIVLDSEIFTLYLAGQINENRIDGYTRNSLWEIEDYYILTDLLRQENQDKESIIITTPNILTEADNFLNRISGEDKYKYLKLVKNIYQKSIEKYIESKSALGDEIEYCFDKLGLSDFAVLKVAKESDLLISADSSLCDHAESIGIKIFDFKKYKSRQLL